MFITDIRNCKPFPSLVACCLNQPLCLRPGRTREQEVQRVNKELANIRNKFRESQLSGYQKKKYVCKLAFMYILGYPIDFGHAEAVNLLASPIYSEKSIVRWFSSAFSVSSISNSGK